MGQLKNLVVHVTATPYGRVVTADDLIFWHMFPKKNTDGTYTYKGKVYKTIAQIPDDSYKINGKVLRVRNYPNNGRGWSQVGYSDLITVDGELVNIVPYNYDSTIDNWELTNGASGYNSVSRHVVCAGGGSKIDPKITSKLMPIDEVLNEKQIAKLAEYLKFQNQMHPGINICGHYDLDSKKTCPNFNVKKFWNDISK